MLVRQSGVVMKSIQEKKVKEKTSKVDLTGINTFSILNPKFVKSLKESGWLIDPATIVLVGHKHNKIKKLDRRFSYLIISHKNSKEIKTKLMHLESEDEGFLTIIKDLLKKL